MNDILLKQVDELLETKELLSGLCNITALLYDYFPNLNWLGFYFFKDDKLILGPFQGKVACETLYLNKGVCGTAYAKQEVLNVEDVHKFPGHIACDSASNSEIVLPLDKYGVLDIDSPLINRFLKNDEELLKEIANKITERIKKDIA